MEADAVVLFEASGVVRDALIRVGLRAVSVDLRPSESDFGPHIRDDVRNVDLAGVRLVIAHPPCTYLCNSGVRWLYTEPGRWDRMREAADMFRWCLDLYPGVPMVAVENPVQHSHAGLPRPTQYVQPWMFGDLESKRTGLWLRGLPPLIPHVRVKPGGVAQSVHKCPPGPDRSIKRSRTFPGIAAAMANQWGRLVK